MDSFNTTQTQTTTFVPIVGVGAPWPTPQPSPPVFLGWTDEAKELLTKLVTVDRLSSSQIGKRMGVTRNTIIGKATRLKLQLAKTQGRPGGFYATKSMQERIKLSLAERRAAQDKNNTQRREREARVKEAKENAQTLFIDDAPVNDFTPVLIETKDHQRDMCSWPTGDPRSPSFRWCGYGRAPGRSYCAAHHRVAYMPTPARPFKVSRFQGFQTR